MGIFTTLCFEEEALKHLIMENVCNCGDFYAYTIYKSSFYKPALKIPSLYDKNVKGDIEFLRSVLTGLQHCLWLTQVAPEVAEKYGLKDDYIEFLDGHKEPYSIKEQILEDINALKDAIKDYEYLQASGIKVWVSEG